MMRIGLIASLFHQCICGMVCARAKVTNACINGFEAHSRELISPLNSRQLVARKFRDSVLPDTKNPTFCGSGKKLPGRPSGEQNPDCSFKVPCNRRPAWHDRNGKMRWRKPHDWNGTSSGRR